jgi:formylglycine-generating enzyme required for sulfatase activity
MRWLIAVAASASIAGLAATGLVVSLSPVAKATSAGPHAKPSVPCQDLDGDGYGLGCAAGLDCNDRDPGVHPGQVERCNLRDDDCSGWVDDAPNCQVPAYDPTPVKVARSVLLMGSAPDQGAADERPRHRVEISGFAMDRYEVTNQRYAACVKSGVCTRPKLNSSGRRPHYFDRSEFGRYPVVFVDWQQAQTFCAWEGGRLPTEAEWELAARGPAPSLRVFPWGDEPADCTKANLGGEKSCVGDTDQVGRRTLGASPWGVLDLSGNVWEWTADWYDAAYYARSPERDPRGPSRGTLKVMRGGCWMSGADSLRVSCRKAELPSTWAPNVGFRCVRPEGK